MFLTLCHMVACTTLGYLLSLGHCTPIKPLRSRKQLWKVCILATIFCLTIVLGNLSLKYIPVSFNQAVGATTPFFTAMFALLLQGGCSSRHIKRTLLLWRVQLHARVVLCGVAEQVGWQQQRQDEQQDGTMKCVSVVG